MRFVSRRNATLLVCLALAAPAHAQPVQAEDGEEPVQAEDVEEGDEAPPIEDEAPAEGEPSEDQAPVEAPAEGDQGASGDEGAGDDEGWGEMSDEDLAAEEGGGDPARPPPAGKGVIWGVVKDGQYNEPAIEAPVTVVGTKIQVVTDFDGRYRLELPPGTYNLRIFYEMHKPLRLEGLKVKAGTVQQVDAVLEAEAPADCDPETDPNCQVETFEIEGKLQEASMESQALKRQQSASASDGITRAEISKTPDSDAASAAQRVPGANIVGGRFVYVRGLGERYSNALLFGSPLPSPEPDRAAVPLDLFPALVLDSVTISKTFTPDMPADFAGGSVQIETRGVPEEFVFSVSASGGYTTGTTFKDRLDYPGSSTDWLAFDDGSRDLPPEVPRDYPATPSEPKPDGTRVRAAELVPVGRALNSRMTPREAFTPPDQGASVVVGNGWLLGGKQKLGLLGSLNYGHSYDIHDGEILRDYQKNPNDPRGFSPLRSFHVDRGMEDIKWGAFGSIAYQPDDKNEIRLMTLHSQAAEKDTNVYYGYDDNTAQRFVNTQLVWVERGMSLGQLSGRHTFDPLNSAELGWDLTLAQATRSEPDRRDVVYNYNPDSEYWFLRDGSESGRHFFADQHENTFGGKLDYTQPIVDATKLKVGGLASLKQREFAARRLGFRRQPTARPVPGTPLACESVSYPLDCPDKLYQDENIDQVIALKEETAESDAYRANLNVYAGYLMGDVELVKSLRAVGGARVEHTYQTIDPFDQFGGKETLERAELNSTDVLPAAGLIFSATSKIKTRVSYSRTLARPQLRELAPFAFDDYFGGNRVSGNPDLKLTLIDNYDMRFEYFPTLAETLAFSFFLKDFDKPIEPVLHPTSSQASLTYENAKAAKAIGVELEARKGLRFLTSSLKDFSVVTNLTLVHSRTEVEQTGNGFITNPSRSLVNQAPWVFNVSLDYGNDVGTHVRGLYNVAGSTLVEVGTDGVPDAYEHPKHSVDLVASQKFWQQQWQVKLTIENLLNSETLITQGKKDTGRNTRQQYKDGTSIGLGLSYTY